MGKWIKLSGSLYMFSDNGINRVESVLVYLNNGVKSKLITGLYNGTKEISRVEETIEEIEGMLKNG